MAGPDDKFERAIGGRIAGVDEAGRGPLAGPVAAAAVVLDPENVPPGLNDSKKLSPARRETLFDMLVEVADISVAFASVEEIDHLNIRAASLLAMTRAVRGLTHPPDHALIDGNALPQGLGCPATTVVKGDARSLSIAAASIIAKVSRDRIMQKLAKDFPGYGWEGNKGYPTAAHREALLNLGVTPHHRRSFGPVHYILVAKTTQPSDSNK